MRYSGLTPISCLTFHGYFLFSFISPSPHGAQDLKWGLNFICDIFVSQVKRVNAQKIKEEMTQLTRQEQDLEQTLIREQAQLAKVRKSYDASICHVPDASRQSYDASICHVPHASRQSYDASICHVADASRQSYDASICHVADAPRQSYDASICHVPDASRQSYDASICHVPDASGQSYDDTDALGEKFIEQMLDGYLSVLVVYREHIIEYQIP